MEKLFIADYFWHFLPRLIEALPVTLAIVVVATLIGTIFGLIIAIIRIERVPILNQIATVIVSFLRGTPIYIQLFIVYFGVPILMSAIGIYGMSMDKMFSVYIAYGLNVGAFFSETFRSAILSVPTAQTEAAQAFGYTKWQTYRQIVFPQALRIAFPNYGSTIVSLLQDTSVAFTIGVVDVMGKVNAIAATAYRSFEGYVAAAVIFIVLSIALDYIFKCFEDKMSFVNKDVKDRVPAKKTSKSLETTALAEGGITND